MPLLAPTTVIGSGPSLCLKRHTYKAAAGCSLTSYSGPVPCNQDENGNLKTKIGERLVWSGYCERLMNVENDWDGEMDYVPAEGL